MCARVEDEAFVHVFVCACVGWMKRSIHVFACACVQDLTAGVRHMIKTRCSLVCHLTLQYEEPVGSSKYYKENKKAAATSTPDSCVCLLRCL